jgi:hypothetical protein
MSAEHLTTMESFGVWDGTHAEDRQAWLQQWRQWPAAEVFAHPDYVQLFARPGQDRAMCAHATTRAGCVLYPLLLRDLSAERVWTPDLGPAADITTPYGYGGPFCWGGEQREELGQFFWRYFQSWADQHHIVSEFVRFSLFPQQLLPYPGQRTETQQNVVRSLEIDEEALWMDMRHKVRKNVKRARASSVEVVRDASGERFEDFRRIYHATLDRRDAERGYYFADEFFQAIHQRLQGQFMYFHALLDGRVVSTELVLVSKSNVYSFLGGTDSQAFEHRPNDLLKFEIMRWARGAGKLRFVLGGGRLPEDGVFRYKETFAPHGLVPFFTGRRILDAAQYARLAARREALACNPLLSATFFPVYRAA